MRYSYRTIIVDYVGSQPYGGIDAESISKVEYIERYILELGGVVRGITYMTQRGQASLFTEWRDQQHYQESSIMLALFNSDIILPQER